MCFCTAAFDTDTFQCAILYQNEGHLILYQVIRLFCVYGKKFTVMIDLKDGNTCPVFSRTLPLSGLNRDMFEMVHMSCTKITHKNFST